MEEGLLTLLLLLSPRVVLDSLYKILSFFTLFSLNFFSVDKGKQAFDMVAKA